MAPWLEWTRVEIIDGPNEEVDVNDGLHSEGIPKTGSVAVLGVMVELRDPGAAEKLTEQQIKKGVGGVWDRAANWQWACMKLFNPDNSRDK